MIKKSLEAGQSLDSIEYLKENNKYAIKIKYLKFDLSPYVCVTNAGNYVKKLLGIQELANVEFECVNNDGTFGFVRYENVSTLNSITVDNTFKYYDSNHNQIQTSIEILREQQINDFKNSCTTFNYKDVLRYPEQYNGKNSYWFGEIVQVVSKDEDSSIFRIDVTCEKYTYLNDYFCTDTIYVYYFGNESFIEHDMVKMWGTMRGSETYSSIFGASITIPKFNALYMELQ